MSMRWILTWKEAPEGTKAKARLVAKGFTDPDLLTIRAEAPTLSKLGRQLLLQLICSSKFKIEVGDVSTAFLQGDKKEQDRDVYLEPTADLRRRLGIDHSHLLKLTGSVYGLRNAPRAWYKRVRADLESLGWRVHQLDQCISCYMMEKILLEYVESTSTTSSSQARSTTPDGRRRKRD